MTGPQLNEWENPEDAALGEIIVQELSGVYAQVLALPPLVFTRADDHEMPEVVCLCGSTRFKDEINAANARLTMQGKLVVSLGVFGHVDMPGHDWTTNGSADKRMLDQLHKRKIDLADRVLVINVGGYIGESTRGEIAYADARGVPVDYLEAPEGEGK